MRDRDIGLGDEDVQALGEGKGIVRDGWLGEALALAAHREAGALPLRPAGVGRAGTSAAGVRADELTWVDPGSRLPPGLAALCARFAALREELRRAAWLSLTRTEIQVARYPGGGAAYARHRDAFRDGRDPRVVTAIYYLNPGWTAAAGGVLRLYTAGADGPVDVEPVLDRIVIFRSELVEHEVLPAHAPRLAVTAWFRR
jgi:SM-20-related protein